MENKKLNILFVVDHFPPAFAPRMGYLAKSLREFGHKIVVVALDINHSAEKEKDFSFLKIASQDVHFCPHVEASSPWQKLSRILRADSSIYALGQKICASQHFDIILSSTHRNFPLKAAQKLSNEFSIPLVCDLRDIIEEYPASSFVVQSPNLKGVKKILANIWGYFLLKQRNSILKKSAAIVSVSKWHIEHLAKALPKYSKERIKLIYNGYDKDVFFKKHLPQNDFKIVYTGAIVSQDLRDPQPLFDAVEFAIKQGYKWAKDLKIEWYCDKASLEIIEKMLSKQSAELRALNEKKKLVAAKDVPNVLNSASVILILNKAQETKTKDTALHKPLFWLFSRRARKYPKGIITSKLFEAMAVEKPILCINDKTSEIASIISETKSGFVAAETKEICDILEKLHSKWEKENCLFADSNLDEVAKYRRDFQAKDFENLFYEILAK